LNIWILVPFCDGSDAVDLRYRDDITSLSPGASGDGGPACGSVPAGGVRSRWRSSRTRGMLRRTATPSRLRVHRGTGRQER